MPGIGLGIGITDISQIALVLNMDGKTNRNTENYIPREGSPCSEEHGSEQQTAPLLLELIEDEAAPGRGTCINESWTWEVLRVWEP